MLIISAVVSLSMTYNGSPSLLGSHIFTFGEHASGRQQPLAGGDMST
jgi:hypothetical protein